MNFEIKKATLPFRDNRTESRKEMAGISFNTIQVVYMPIRNRLTFSYIVQWQFYDKTETDNVRVTSHCGAFVQPLLPWKSNNYYYIFWVCVCSLRYPACNALAPCCRLWPVRLYNIFFFPCCLVNGTIFEKKKLWNIKCVCCDFLYKFCLKHFSIYEELSEIWS